MFASAQLQADENEWSIAFDDITLEEKTVNLAETLPPVVLENLPEDVPEEVTLNQLEITDTVLNAVVGTEEDELHTTLTLSSTVTETEQDGSSTVTDMVTTVTIDATATNHISTQTVCSEGIIVTSCIELSINEKIWNVSLIGTTTADANVISETQGSLIVNVNEVASSDEDTATSLVQTEPESPTYSTIEGVTSYDYDSTTNTTNPETAALKTYYLAATGARLEKDYSPDKPDYDTWILLADITGDTEPDYYDDYIQVMGILYQSSKTNGSTSLFEGSMDSDYAYTTAGETTSVPKSQGGGTKTLTTTYSEITGDNISVYVDKTSYTGDADDSQTTETLGQVDINYTITKTTTYSNGSPTQYETEDDSINVDQEGITTANTAVTDENTVTAIEASNLLSLQHQDDIATIEQQTTATITVSGAGVINGDSTQVAIDASTSTSINDAEPTEDSMQTTFLCEADSSGTYDALCGKVE